MNLKFFVMCFFLIVMSVSIASCAKQAEVIQPFKSGSSPIKSLAIVFEQPAFTPHGEGKFALDRYGWSTGALERSFCNGLILRMRERRVNAYCSKSFWGGNAYKPDQSHSKATHILSIRPLNLRYIAYKSRETGEVIPNSANNPRMETLTNIYSRETNELVWSGKIELVFYELDQTGAGRYADSLLEALDVSNAIEAR